MSWSRWWPGTALTTSSRTRSTPAGSRPSESATRSRGRRCRIRAAHAAAVWVDVQKDPTDRSLPPFEFMILGAESSTAYSGAAAVHLVGALTGRAPEPRPIAGRGPTCLTSNEMFKSEVTRSRLGHLGLRARHENCGDIRDDTTQHARAAHGAGCSACGHETAFSRLISFGADRRSLELRVEVFNLLNNSEGAITP